MGGEPATGDLHDSVAVVKGREQPPLDLLVGELRLGELGEGYGKAHTLKVAGEGR